MFKLDNEVKMVIKMDDVEGLENWISSHGPISREIGYQLFKNVGESDSVGCLEVLLEKGVDVEYRSPGRLPILSLMLLRGSEKCFKMLVENGVYCDQTVGLLMMGGKMDWLKLMFEVGNIRGKKLNDWMCVSWVLGKEEFRLYFESLGGKCSKLKVSQIKKMMGSVVFDVDMMEGKIEEGKGKVEVLMGKLEGCMEKKKELEEKMEGMMEEIGGEDKKFGKEIREVRWEEKKLNKKIRIEMKKLNVEMRKLEVMEKVYGELVEVS